MIKTVSVLMKTTEMREKVRLLTPVYYGKESPNWQGGKSFEPYSKQFTESLKQFIRERDGYLCVCNNYGDHVHHIDYNKLNCKSNNLITLCEKCHGITNGNRKYWENYLFNVLQKRIEGGVSEIRSIL
ncbi:hypothetical protein CMI37_39305 [Candidatus Pacearchaeota archaeon]|nr:hypothetical protein [Candidatus Pacearchaeota archaeon]